MRRLIIGCFIQVETAKQTLTTNKRVLVLYTFLLSLAAEQRCHGECVLECLNVKTTLQDHTAKRVQNGMSTAACMNKTQTNRISCVFLYCLAVSVRAPPVAKVCVVG